MKVHKVISLFTIVIVVTAEGGEGISLAPTHVFPTTQFACRALMHRKNLVPVGKRQYMRPDIGYDAKAFVLAPDGESYITGGGIELGTFVPGTVEGESSFMVSDGNIPSGIVECWDKEGQWRWGYRKFKEDGKVVFVKFVDKKTIVVGSQDGTVRMLNSANGHEIARAGEEVPRNQRRLGHLDLHFPKDFSLSNGQCVLLADFWPTKTITKVKDVDRPVIWTATRVYTFSEAALRKSTAANSFQELASSWSTLRDIGATSVALTPDGEYVLVFDVYLSMLRRSDLALISCTDYRDYGSGGSRVLAVRPGVAGEIHVLLSCYTGQVHLWRLNTEGPDPFLPATQAEQRFVSEDYVLPRNPGEKIREFKGRNLSQAHAANEMIKDLVFSPDGRLAATAAVVPWAPEWAPSVEKWTLTIGGSVCVWDVNTGEELARIKVPGHGFWRVGFAANGQIAVTCSDGTVRFYAIPGAGFLPAVAAVGPE